MEEVILVTESDEPVGRIEKMQAHKRGLLHRAFSVLIFNSKQELLLQKRAVNKYHSGGLWTNTCCSHPVPDEVTVVTAQRRLEYEMGITCHLNYLYSFIYKVEFENGLIEHELDYVFAGISNNEPSINVEEVSQWKLMSLDEVKADAVSCPEQYTEWFKIIINRIDDSIF